jgi:hypothetical protein
MHTPPEKIVRLVERAAELRAAGHTWEQIAKKLRRSLAIRGWRRRYPEFWNRAIADARRELAAQASAEGLTVLRNLLLSQDEKVRRDASARLLALRPNDDLPQPPPSDLLRYVQILEGMTDDDLESLLAESVRAVAARPEHPAAGDPNPASAA